MHGFVIIEILFTNIKKIQHRHDCLKTQADESCQNTLYLFCEGMWLKVNNQIYDFQIFSLTGRLTTVSEK